MHGRRLRPDSLLIITAERLKAMYEPPYLAYYTSKAGFDEAVDLITEHLEEDGPFDGVFAFSQGCHLAAAFMSALAQNELGSQVFRFAVFIGASPRLEYDVEGDKRQRRLHVPILHVIGRNDEHRLESLEFVAMHSADSDPVVLEHDGGHHIPIDVSVRYTITRYMSGQVNGGAMAA